MDNGEGEGETSTNHSTVPEDPGHHQERENEYLTFTTLCKYCNKTIELLIAAMFDESCEDCNKVKHTLDLLKKEPIISYNEQFVQAIKNLPIDKQIIHLE